MDVLKNLKIKDSPSVKKLSKSQQKNDSGSILGGLAGTAMAALPLVPKKYIIMAGSAIAVTLYGAVSLIWDIISLF